MFASRLSIVPALVLAGLLTATAMAQVPTAIPVDGKPFPAELAGTDTDWNLYFSVPPGEDQQAQAAPQPRKLAAADLVCWGAPVDSLPSRMQLLLLADGSRLIAEVLSADERSWTVDSLVFGELKIDRRMILAVDVRPSSSPQARDEELGKLQVGEISNDQLLLENGDRIGGRVISVGQEDFQNEQGQIARRKVIRLATEFQPIRVELNRVRAVRFKPLTSTEAPTGLTAWVGLRDGSLLQARSLEAGADIFELKPAWQRDSDPAWEAIARKPLSQITFIQPLGGRAVYLSDREPAAYRHVPFLDLKRPYHADRNVLGSTLRSGGRAWTKGLGQASAGMLVYDVPAGYQRFDAELALDDLADGRGSVEFRILLDGEEQFRKKVSGRGPPVPVSVKLSGPGKLVLFVGYADGGDVLDYANWLNARLIK